MTTDALLAFGGAAILVAAAFIAAWVSIEAANRESPDQHGESKAVWKKRAIARVSSAEESLHAVHSELERL